MLYSVGRPLDLTRDGSKYMKEYHFIHMEALVFTERAHGGSKLQALEGHIQLTKEPCCVTLEKDDDEFRVKLACKHAISMYCHCAIACTVHLYFCHNPVVSKPCLQCDCM